MTLKLKLKMTVLVMINTFRYVITGTGCKSLVVHSPLQLNDIRQLVYEQSNLCHPSGMERVWLHGMISFVNPVVHCAEDYINGSYMGITQLGINND